MLIKNTPLGALTNAIHEFNGGVVIISHNKEFTNAVTTEKWIMEKGRLHKEGESVDKNSNDNDLIKEDKDTIIDSLGNVVKIERKIVLTDKEKKRMIKNIQKQIKEGKKKNSLSGNEILELEDKLDELQLVE